MKLKPQGHEQRKKQAQIFWEMVLADYNAGMTAQEIARRYRNPYTGKYYSRQHIHWILKKYK